MAMSSYELCGGVGFRHLTAYRCALRSWGSMTLSVWLGTTRAWATVPNVRTMIGSGVCGADRDVQYGAGQRAPLEDLSKADSIGGLTPTTRCSMKAWRSGSKARMASTS